MAPNPNIKKTFPLILPHIPDSLTSGSLRSEDSPTPAPKRRKTAISSSLPRVAGDTSSLSDLASTIQTLSQTVEELLRRGSPPKVINSVLEEEEEDEEDEEEEETDTGSETSSEQEETNFGDFETEGMTEEELKAWSSAAPKDQKLVMAIEEPPVHPSRKVHFSDQMSGSGKVDDKIKRQWMDNFIRNHTFFKLRQASAPRPTPAQERAFEKEVYDHAKRKLGFSVRNAKKQIVKAKQMCGYDDGDSEVKDSKSSISPNASIDKLKSNTLDGDSSTNTNSQAKGIQAAKESVDPKAKLDPNARPVSEITNKGKSDEKHSSKKRKRDQPHSGDTEPVSEAADIAKSTKKRKKKKSKQVESHSADSLVQTKSPEPKSDGINGDPSQLPEVPDELSVHLDSKDPPSKLDAVQSEKAPPKSAEVDARTHTNVASSNLETTEAPAKTTKEERDEKKARKKERRRNEKLAQQSSTNDEAARLPAASTSFDDAGKMQQESLPSSESKTPRTSKGDKKKKREQELQIRAEPSRQNSNGGGEESGQKPKKAKHSHSSPSNSNSKKRPLELIVDEAVPQSKKHKKKKHKPEDTAIIPISGFQSPMIHDAETADEGTYESVLQETMSTESTSTSAATAFSKLSNADIDLLFPFIATPTTSHLLTTHNTNQIALAHQTKAATPRTSPYFPTPPRTPRPKVKRPAVSCIPFPPLSASRFGLVQESLARSPFALLIAVIFLNKTRGKVALPLFYQLMKKWPTPEKLAAAEIEEVVQVFSTLGLQNQRAKKVVALAKAWVENMPRRGRRWRRLHYPRKGDGADVGRDEVLGDEDDNNTSEDYEKREQVEENKVKGNKRIAWEVGRLPGVGSYAIDSWRIFCRDELRGLPHGLPPLDELTHASQIEAHADSHQSPQSEKTTQNKANKTLKSELSKEWTRVLPQDKELRAYLRWRWLRVGYIWDPDTGARERASVEVIREAERGVWLLRRGRGSLREFEGERGGGCEG
ncbi:hypothetical protein G7Y79_00046g082020 [Physcia stellaris]|nr:hypothetical protein G7Y79_00046g082020 [Physcia stellaris]